jgi:hypothetical protein
MEKLSKKTEKVIDKALKADRKDAKQASSKKPKCKEEILEEAMKGSAGYVKTLEKENEELKSILAKVREIEAKEIAEEQTKSEQEKIKDESWKDSFGDWRLKITPEMREQNRVFEKPPEYKRPWDEYGDGLLPRILVSGPNDIRIGDVNEPMKVTGVPSNARLAGPDAFTRLSDYYAFIGRDDLVKRQKDKEALDKAQKTEEKTTVKRLPAVSMTSAGNRHTIRVRKDLLDGQRFSMKYGTEYMVIDIVENFERLIPESQVQKAIDDMNKRHIADLQVAAGTYSDTGNPQVVNYDPAIGLEGPRGHREKVSEILAKNQEKVAEQFAAEANMSHEERDLEKIAKLSALAKAELAKYPDIKDTIDRLEADKKAFENEVKKLSPTKKAKNDRTTKPKRAKKH